MSENTDEDRSIFTGRAPGFLSQWDAETFEKAGLTPFDKLKDRYGDNYTMLVTEAEALRQKLDTDQWQIIVTKCEMGGMIKLAKNMTAHGGKGAVPRDFKVSGDTALLYERAYDNMPWAYEDIRKKAAEALAKGQDYIYSLREIIEIGEKNAIAAGAKKVRPKYVGTGKVFIYDTAMATGTYEDLPNPFPGQKRIRADVHPKPPYWEPVEGYVVGPAKLWKEVNRDAPDGDKPYFTLRLTTAGKDGGTEQTVPFKQRVMIALIDRKNVVQELKPTIDLLTLANFEAREPHDVQIIDIDPTTGKVERHTLPDDDFTEEPAEAFTPLSGLCGGLTLVQTEPADEMRFTLAGQSFAGRSYIVRLGDTTALGARWLAPLKSSLSAGDVAQHISFDTFDAVNKIKGKVPVPDPNAGFEVLDAETWQDYFGAADNTAIYRYLNREFQTTSRYAADRAATQAGILGVLRGKAAWHVVKLREIVERQKEAAAEEERKAAEDKAKAEAAVAAAEADGFVQGMPDDYDDNTGDDVLAALNLTRDAELSEVNLELEARGLFRQIGGKFYYRTDMVDALLNPVEHPPATETVDGGFGTGPTSTADALNQPQYRPEAQPAEPVEATSDQPEAQPQRPVEPVEAKPEPMEPVEATSEPVTPAEPVEATSEPVTPAEPMEATSEPVTPAEPVEATSEPVTPAEPVEATSESEAKPETVEATGEPVTPAEPVEATSETVTPVEQVEATTEPVVAAIEPEIVEPPYAEMGYEDQQREDRKLVENVNGKLDSIERRAIGILAAFNGEDREIRNPRVKMMVDDVRFIRDTAREAHGSLTALVDHMDILKAKVAPDDPLAAVKRDITRLAPHLDLKTVEILAFYVKTPSGTVTVFNGEDKAEQPTA